MQECIFGRWYLVYEKDYFWPSVFGYANLNFLVTIFGNLLLILNHYLHYIPIFQHNAVGYSSIQGNPDRVDG